MDEELQDLIDEYLGEQEVEDVVPKPVDVEETPVVEEPASEPQGEPDVPPEIASEPQPVEIPIENVEMTEQSPVMQDEMISQEPEYSGEDEERVDISSWLDEQEVIEPQSQTPEPVEQIEPEATISIDEEPVVNLVGSVLDDEPTVSTTGEPQFVLDSVDVRSVPSMRPMDPVGQFESSSMQPEQVDIAGQVADRIGPLIDSKMSNVAFNDDMQYHIDLLGSRDR